MTTDEVIRKVGDPKVLAKELRQSDSDSRYLESHWDELLKKHRNQWVGVQHKRCIYADSLADLFATAKRQGWDLGTMVVDCLTDERPALLL